MSHPDVCSGSLLEIAKAFSVSAASIVLLAAQPSTFRGGQSITAHR